MRARALLFCVLLAACERKAPGPTECVALAETTLGPRAPRAAHEELVRQCLTTPFDRAMLACAERSGALRTCYAQFERRRRGNL